MFYALTRKIRRTALAFLGVTLVLWMVPMVTSEVDPVACRKWHNRAVREDTLVASDILKAAKNTRVVRLPASMSTLTVLEGLSIPGVVAVFELESRYDAARLRWHEMAHQHQYRRDGIFAFFNNYASDFRKGLINGCTVPESYLGIRYELEAELAADSVYVSSCAYLAILEPALVSISIESQESQASKVADCLDDSGGYYRLGRFRPRH